MAACAVLPRRCRCSCVLSHRILQYSLIGLEVCGFMHNPFFHSGSRHALIDAMYKVWDLSDIVQG
eukprot:12910637-Prorocentrum_lima.AAC.1